jgi:hypothetical protein
MAKAEIQAARFWKTRNFPTSSKRVNGPITELMLTAKSLNPGAAAINALFITEKNEVSGAKNCTVPLTKLSSEGLFW